MSNVTFERASAANSARCLVADAVGGRPLGGERMPGVAQPPVRVGLFSRPLRTAVTRLATAAASRGVWRVTRT